MKRFIASFDVGDESSEVFQLFGNLVDFSVFLLEGIEKDGPFCLKLNGFLFFEEIDLLPMNLTLFF